MRYLITLFLSLAMLITDGCGFRVQGRRKILEELKTLRLSSDDPYGPLARAIRQQLRLNNVNLINENLKNVPILKIVGSSENTKTVSIYQDGKSAEKQLNFWVSAQIILPNGGGAAVYPIKTRVERASFFDNTLETLAKDVESELIKQEMREQAARQLIRKLLIVHGTIQNKPKESVVVRKALSVDSE